MKKYIILLVIPLLFLTGCGNDETVMRRDSIDQNIEDIKKCEDAGIDWYKNNIGEVKCGKQTDKWKEAEDACIKQGGIPIRSLWDNRMKDCKFNQEYETE